MLDWLNKTLFVALCCALSACGSPSPAASSPVDGSPTDICVDVPGIQDSNASSEIRQVMDLGGGEEEVAGREEVGCTPNCALNSLGPPCGDDGCGGSCGTCADGVDCLATYWEPDLHVCFDLAQQCEEMCILAEAECGPLWHGLGEGDWCDCGACADGEICKENTNTGGVCVPEPCVPDCEGRECGDDGCGQLCGYCIHDAPCEEGTCQYPYWTDPTSGLVWQKPPAPDPMHSHDGISYCDALALAGFADWRLPDISELRTLVRGCSGTEPGGSCALTAECNTLSCFTGFCACPLGQHQPEDFLDWTTGLISSTHDGDGIGIVFGMDYCYARIEAWSLTQEAHVRCVRSQQ